MKLISYIEQIDKDGVSKEEKKRKQDYTKVQREQKSEEEHIQIKMKKKDLEERMDRVFQKVGRQTMPRSMKKSVKREVRVQKIEQETLDRQRYLGELISNSALPVGNAH